VNKKVSFNGRPVWAEISLGAIASNLREIRRHIGAGRKILAVVKANAYGLGAVEISRALSRAGADWFGVTSASEGAELRRAGIREPILVLTGFWPGEEPSLFRWRLTPTVTDAAQLAGLERAYIKAKGAAARGRYPFHLKINSGMNRLGIAPDSVEHFARALDKCRHLTLQGTYTHFASAEDFTSPQTAEQEGIFLDAVRRLRATGVDPGMIHLANSGAICARPSTWADMVRAGAILYGYHQNFQPPVRKRQVARSLLLRPSLALRARIIALQHVAPGGRVGYGATFVASRPSRIAVLAAGYADGLVRSLGNRGSVLVRGHRAPIVGIVSMDLSAVDVTAIPRAAVGDVATIYGRDGRDAIEVSDAARQIGSVTSDLLCALGQRVPRHYLR
jgi:alanine racemase